VVRVVVCDDSPFFRRLARSMLSRDPLIEVVGEAATGIEAVEVVQRERPDVLMLDLQLPDMDGETVLAAVKATNVRTVVVSSVVGGRTGERAVAALSAGALEVIPKPPEATAHEYFSTTVRETIVAIGNLDAPERPIGRYTSRLEAPTARPSAGTRLIVIGASTGGPASIEFILRALPPQVPAPVLIVQHMPPGFGTAFANRLDRVSASNVRIADNGCRLEPGTIYVAETGRHLHVEGDTAFVRFGRRVQGMRPSVDVTLQDAARTWGDRVTAIILTGMGRDGLDGARAVRTAGGHVFVEDRSTCAVWGMPRAVKEAGQANGSVPLDEIPALIVKESVA
jgi:two-component system chemotaxis response regulator CheB